MGQQQVCGVSDDRQFFLQVLRSQPPQLRQAHGVPIARKFQRAGRNLPQATAQTVLVHPVVGQPAAARFERRLAGFEDLLQVPFGIEGGWRRPCVGWRHAEVAAELAAHEEPGVPTADQEPLGHQTVIGFHHREGAHRIGRGERPNRRHLGAGLERFVGDQGTKRVNDLIDQRGGRIGVKLQHGNAFR